MEDDFKKDLTTIRRETVAEFNVRFFKTSNMKKEQVFFKWKDDEKADLLRLVSEGKDFREIGDFLTQKYRTFRSPSACKSKLEFIKKQKK